MAKKKAKASAGAAIDWYLISVDRLKQVSLVVVLLILGVLGYWYWERSTGNPRANAQSAIAEAFTALNQFAASPEHKVREREFARAQRKLDEARSMFASARFLEAQSSAIESHTISRSALSGGEPENDARFLTVEGDVRFQKRSTSDWKPAENRTALFNGDWVKTADRASAQLMFSNGSVYTVGPNALLEIFSAVNPATSQRTNAVQMQIGSVEVATKDDVSAVRTPGTEVMVASESTTQIGVDREKSTTAVTTKGTASITSATGGPAVQMTTGDKVSATQGGQLSPVKKLVMPPPLLSPADNQLFQMTDDLRVNFTWGNQEGARGYVLQVSRSRLFSTLEINSRRERTAASARVTSEGAFYWRVAAIGPDGDVGPFSPFRRFRVSGVSRGPTIPTADTQPPPLRLNKPASIGGPFFMVEGSTEAGATVFINDEEVDVDPSGNFKKLVSFNRTGSNAVVVKAVDPAGNQTVKSETVFVED